MSHGQIVVVCVFIVLSSPNSSWIIPINKPFLGYFVINRVNIDEKQTYYSYNKSTKTDRK